MPQLSDLIATTHRYLESGRKVEINQLANPVSANATTISLSNNLGGITQGVYVGIDLEIYYVLSTNTSANIATVLPGQLGSTSTSHTSNTTVYVNPRFSDFAISKAINDDLLDLSSPSNGLFQMLSTDITFNPVYRGYDLGVPAGTDIIDLYDIRYKTVMPTKYWPSIRDYQLARNMNTSEFASGYALFINEPGWPSQPMHVLYKATFSPLVNTTDDAVTTAGLPATAVDIPPIGAAIRLMAGREIERNFVEAQGNPKRAEDVPPGAIAGSPKNLMMLRVQRIQAEADRLKRAYPSLTRRS